MLIIAVCSRVCAGSIARPRELITISDDSDEEPVTLVPGSPVLVPDDADDDDIKILEVRDLKDFLLVTLWHLSICVVICLFCHPCFLQQLTPARRHVIRPAAKWSGAPRNLIQVLGHSSSTSGVPTEDSSPAPSTSRDANTATVIPAIHTQTSVQSSTYGHTQPQPGPSSYTLSQPQLGTNSQQQEGTSAHRNVGRHAVSSTQTTTTSTHAKTNANSSRAPTIFQSLPSTSRVTQPKAGPSSCLAMEPQAGTSASATPYSCAAAVTAATVSTNTQEKASTSTPTEDSSQASTPLIKLPSHTQTEPQPGTSAQLKSTRTTILQPQVIQVKKMKLVVLPQQPSTQASSLITQPQPQLRTQILRQPLFLNQMQGNLIQIEPQLLAEAPAQPQVQPPHPPQVIPVIPPAVLIAAAPERLGPPEAGHRIILGSQAPGEAAHHSPPQAGARRVNFRVPNANSNAAAPAATASAPHNVREEARIILAPAPNPERINAAPGVVMVPPALEDIPQIEDARPGPSAPRERPEERSLVRTLITGVVSIA